MYLVFAWDAWDLEKYNRNPRGHISERFDFVQAGGVYMAGFSHGGMMTYIACRMDDRVTRSRRFEKQGLLASTITTLTKDDLHDLHKRYFGYVLP